MNEEQEIAEATGKRELYNAFWEESSDAIKPFRGSADIRVKIAHKIGFHPLHQ
ncbi:hypothetical protein LPY96_19325 [Xanthomonas citri pv. malvacearum]|uniref:hypothetical protein n=1 Tax=Xanthomonas citri TaxID=346 RepID=UPI0022AEBD40|nr:hypothetical protein [Xanthomonas citri]WAW89291.1 hypothetical protein LPY96_19325 [Xanthomonas citri pv. malvacearum]